jgi:hypothetical protein
MIHTAFTTNFGLPIPAAGERQWAQLMARAFEIIDNNLSGAGVGLTTQGATTTTVSAGKSLVAAHIIYLPEGAKLDIREGGAVKIL